MLIEESNLGYWKKKVALDWHQIFGDISPLLDLIDIDRDLLTVQVNDKIWLEEFYLLCPLLIKMINRAAGDAYIKKMRFRLKKN